MSQKLCICVCCMLLYCVTSCKSTVPFSRLHREALKQAATDPKTGIIDISILTTGVSSSERQRREALAKEIRKVLQGKAKGASTLKSSAVFDAVREQSQIVSCSSGTNKNFGFFFFIFFRFFFFF